MNHAYRLVWNETTCRYVPAPETARGRGKSGKRTAVVALCAALLASGAWAGPSGGTVSAGSGSISHSGATTTITQGSQNLAINWASFGIAAGERVNFVQPGASAIALNRVIGAESSVINGTLSANGQVWILNPNGVLFGSTASVNVGGLVASTLSLSDADFLAGKRSFTANGSQGSVVNQGSLSGGYVALLGKQASNSGTITTANGTAALAAGDKVTLDFSGNRLLSVQVDEGTLNALAENKGLIRADNGTVILTASAKEALLATVVNNEGVIEAKGIDSSGGTILLLGGFNGGTVKVAGTLDASASGAHNGGFIETSGAHVQVAGGARISTKSESGKTGTWLVDPTDFTISAGSASQAASGIGADTLSANLATTSVTLATDASAGTDGGDIHVNAAVSWSASTTLTLNAYNDIHINAPITATGTSAGLVLNHGNYASTGTVAGGTDYHVKAPITLSGANASLGIIGTAYTLLHSMAEIDAIDSTGLGGNYALAQDLDASGTTYTGALVGSNSNGFAGTFTGLGHTISNLTISAGGTDFVGLFGKTATDSMVRDIGVAGGSVSGNFYVGGLVGWSDGSAANVYSTASISGSENVGGLIGVNWGGAISDAYATGTVTGSINNVGGLVGTHTGSLVNVYATGNVTGADYVGGLVGKSIDGGGGSISNAYATGSVSGNYLVGGLVGDSYSSISNAYATGSVSGNYLVGGLVGNSYSSISNAYATGSVSGYEIVGGLVGENHGGISNAYATGSTSGTYHVGGLVGYGYSSSSISNAYVTGSVNGHDIVGGLVGSDRGSISNAYATGNVSGGARVGGLVGYSSGNIDNAYATGSVSGYGVGGLVGTNTGSISNAYATGSVSANIFGGGLVGANEGSISNSYWDSSSTGQSAATGYNDGSVSNVTAVDSSTAYSHASYANLGTWNETASGSGVWVANNGSNNTWVMVEGSTRPFLYSEYSTTIRNAHQLQLMAVDTSASYTLAHDINASETSGSNASGMWTTAGFASVGSGAEAFTGSLNGAGHVVSGLVINRANENTVGLIGYAESSSSIHDIGLVGGSVVGSAMVGGLAGYNGGSIINAYSSANVTGSSDAIGGLVGWNTGSISASYATGNVSGNYVVGGLVGENLGTISDAHATGTVSGGSYVGGLAGESRGAITNVYATGNVSGHVAGNQSSFVGGLVGQNHDSISDAYATGSVSGDNYVGGLVGYNTGGSISNVFASGDTSGVNAVGGLVGYNTDGSISDALAIGNVRGDGYDIGGLVGSNYSSTISNAYATGNVSGGAGSDSVGGLVGADYFGSNISNVYATGSVSGNINVGGLLGWAYQGSLSNAYATGSVSGNDVVGGLIGYAESASISNTYSSGAVSGTSNAGGLLGSVGADVTITSSYWNTTTSGQGTSAGGTGLTSAQMMQASSFSGWDLATTGSSTSVWRIYEGYTAPLLRSFMIATTVAVGSGGSWSYDGTVHSVGLSYSADASVDTSLIGVGNAGYINAGTYSLGTHLYSGQEGYDISYTGGTLTIDRAVLTVGSTDVSKTYDGTTTAHATTVVIGGTLYGTDSLSGGSFAYADSNAGTGKTVATSGVTVNDGNGGGNYDVSYVDNTGGTITAAALTVTANNDSRTANGTAYSGGNGVSYSGFVAGESSSVLGGSLVYGGSAQGAAGPGIYSIAASGLSASNYALSYVDGTLVIGAAPVTPVRPAVPSTPAVPVTPVTPAVPSAPTATAAPAASPDNANAPLTRVLQALQASPPGSDLQLPAPLSTPDDETRLLAGTGTLLHVQDCGVRLTAGQRCD